MTNIKEYFGGYDTGTSVGGLDTPLGTSYGYSSDVGTKYGFSIPPGTSNSLNYPLGVSQNNPTYKQHYIGINYANPETDPNIDKILEQIVKINIKYINSTFIPYVAQQMIDNIPHLLNNEYGLSNPTENIKDMLSEINQQLLFNQVNPYHITQYDEINNGGVKTATVYYENGVSPQLQGNYQILSNGTPITSLSSSSIPTLTNTDMKYDENNDDNIQLKKLNKDQLAEYKQKYKKLFGNLSNIQQQDREDILTKENFTNTKNKSCQKHITYILILTTLILSIIFVTKIIK